MSMVQAGGPAAPPAPGGRPQVATPQAPAGAPAGAGRLAGLDGLRALAILAVLVFHLDPTWLPGGFLGVDVFFVVSGFLITTLLVRERVTSGRTDLPGFWARRARRLVPALLVCVPSAVLLARLSEGDLLVGIERQVLGATTFTSNWLEIHAGTDYFAATSPQLLMNLWSLAVEEQFYLLWPLLLIGLLRLPRAWQRGCLVAAVVVAALAPLRLVGGDTLHAYYGSDVHAMPLLLGALLAWLMHGHRAADSRPVVAAVALAGVLVLALASSTFRLYLAPQVVAGLTAVMIW
ncbi:MAG: acyltransferase family protein, partial [Ornithinibacter sp.]